MNEDFRNSIATTDKDNKRILIRPKKPSGRLHNYRLLVGWIILGLFAILPFITIGGQQIILLDILQRKFFIFGFRFWAQDSFIFAVLTISVVLSIILFTSIFGRIWCGWTCPQTLFMELIYRKIEYLFEGDRNKQLKMMHEKLNFKTFIKKFAKHIVFLLVSFYIILTATFYFMTPQGTIDLLFGPFSGHVFGKIMIPLATLVTYGIYARFREQICVLLCPYGRIQSVLIDDKTLVVSYDHKRGEPRNRSIEAKESGSTGDCIDCKRCVQVCPTGIDIRNGIQLECINCTACIDECNDVMRRIKKPEGLIKLASIHQVETGSKFKLNFKAKGYILILVLMFILDIFVIMDRDLVNVTLSKVNGQTYKLLKNNKISNLYSLRITNRTDKQIPYKIVIKGIDCEIKIIGKKRTDIESEESIKVKLLVKVDLDKLNSGTNEFVLNMVDSETGEILGFMKSTFFKP